MTNTANFPLLSLILFTPLAGALLLLFVSRKNEDAIRWIANVVTAAGFLVSVPLWFRYDSAIPIPVRRTGRVDPVDRRAGTSLPWTASVAC